MNTKHKKWETTNDMTFRLVLFQCTLNRPKSGMNKMIWTLEKKILTNRWLQWNAQRLLAMC